MSRKLKMMISNKTAAARMFPWVQRLPASKADKLLSDLSFNELQNLLL